MTIKELEKHFGVKIYPAEAGMESHRKSYYIHKQGNTSYMSPDFSSMDNLIKDLKKRIKKKYVVKVKKVKLSEK